MEEIFTHLNVANYFQELIVIFNDFSCWIGLLDSSKFYSLGKKDEFQTSEMIELILSIKKMYTGILPNGKNIICSPISKPNGEIIACLIFSFSGGLKDIYLFKIITEILTQLLNHIVSNNMLKLSQSNIFLTDREEEVFQRVLKGMKDSQMADEMNISKPTIRKHLENIYFKFNVSGKVELICNYHMTN